MYERHVPHSFAFAPTFFAARKQELREKREREKPWRANMLQKKAAEEKQPDGTPPKTDGSGSGEPKKKSAMELLGLAEPKPDLTVEDLEEKAEDPAKKTPSKDDKPWRINMKRTPTKPKEGTNADNE